MGFGDWLKKVFGGAKEKTQEILDKTDLDEKIVEKAGQLKEAAKDKAGELGEVAKEKAGKLGEAAKEKAGELGETAKAKAGQLGEAAREKAGELGEAAKAKVQEALDKTDIDDKIKAGVESAKEKVEGVKGKVIKETGAVEKVEEEVKEAA
ncbi:MAG: hypothetical protein IKG59_06220, partial [Firmicutes bacterium]|nr:hypothetical protein [Bacillota bacterium]